MKKLIVYDLDGTLAESKSSLDTEMSALLHDLLGIVQVAVISGGDWPQFEKQVLSHLPHDESLVNLSLLPTCGTKFFQYKGDWKKIYSEDFTVNEKEKIASSLKKAVLQAGFKVEKVWGEVIEDRGSQITFSALGQQAPLEEKKKWDPDFTKRKKIKALLDNLIPEKWRNGVLVEVETAVISARADAGYRVDTRQMADSRIRVRHHPFIAQISAFVCLCLRYDALIPIAWCKCHGRPLHERKTALVVAVSLQLLSKAVVAFEIVVAHQTRRDSGVSHSFLCRRLHIRGVYERKGTEAGDS